MTSFTTVLSSPLNLKPFKSYEAALVQINIPHLYDTKDEIIAKDVVVIGQKAFEIELEDNSLTNMIENVLKYSALDPRIYNITYFKDFLNKQQVFNTKMLKESNLSQYAVKGELPEERSIQYDFRLEQLVNTSKGKKKDDFLPPVDYLFTSIVKFFEEGGRDFPINFELTLNQILYSLIGKIYTSMSIHTKTIEEQEQYYTALALDAKGKEKHRKYLMQINEIIHRFIDHFVKSVIETCEKLTIESKLPDLYNDSYICVYCDFTENIFIGDSKARVLSVLDTKQFLNQGFIQYPSYIAVEKSDIRTVSIVLTSLEGTLLNLAPSTSPVHVCLRFREKE